MTTAGVRGCPSRLTALRRRFRERFPASFFHQDVVAHQIANTGDRSYSIAPELLYTRVTNLELRLRAIVLRGGAGTDFGEKQSDRRIEFRVRWFF